MKPIVIIAISVICSVGAIIAVQSFSDVDFSEVDVGEGVANIVPFDCAKAWDTMWNSLRIQNNTAFQELSHEEQDKIRKYNGLIRDEYHKNLCDLNHEEWVDRSVDKDGRLAQITNGDLGLSWNSAINSEYEYNEKFPDGAYGDW